jgi:hypothetical protein
MGKRKNTDLRVLEFSKKLVNRVLIIFALHLVLTFGALFIVPLQFETAISLFGVALPFYITAIGGYFGKAGVENSLKIKNNQIQVAPDEESAG